MKDWSEYKVKNKIKTPGYFIKRLKDNGFVVLKMFNAYSKSDPRRWTVLVDPGYHSVYITCYTNKDEKGDTIFEFYDGCNNFHHGFFIKTESIEAIVNQLIEKGVNNNPKKNPFFKLK